MNEITRRVPDRLTPGGFGVRKVGKHGDRVIKGFVMNHHEQIEVWTGEEWEARDTGVSRTVLHPRQVQHLYRSKYQPHQGTAERARRVARRG